MKTALLTLALSATLLSTLPAHAHHPQVSTDRGVVRGIETTTVRKFLGIPYAAPPIGALRWQPPQPAAGWSGVRDATAFAPHCAQPSSPFGIAALSEDCLYLNVYTPNERCLHRDAHRRHPVMVWIHGGALVVGQSDNYDPTRLVERGDVVVVTINYRLGPLGFLAHPALTAESPDGASGNYGFLDQHAALRWVQRNIEGFGGDADRVTVFGESAGGLSTHVHLASPLAGGLFHRAIVQSGAYQLAQPTLAQAEAIGVDFANAAACADQSASCLRALPVETLLANPRARATATPVIDGKVLTTSIEAAFESGNFHRMPVIEGSNHDEWTLFLATNIELLRGPLTEAQYPATAAAVLGVPLTAVQPIVDRYPLAAYPSPGAALASLATDAIFACRARRAQRSLSEHVSTYAYEFNDPNAPQYLLPPISVAYGAFHAAEVQYLFDLHPAIPTPALDEDQRQLSDAMIDLWTSFARHGRPHEFGEPRWRRFHAGSEHVLSLVPPEPERIADFAADHQCEFWGAR